MLDTGFNTPEDQKKAVEYVREVSFFFFSDKLLILVYQLT